MLARSLARSLLLPICNSNIALKVVKCRIGRSRSSDVAPLALTFQIARKEEDVLTLFVICRARAFVGDLPFRAAFDVSPRVGMEERGGAVKPKA